MDDFILSEQVEENDQEYLDFLEWVDEQEYLLFLERLENGEE